MAKSRSDLIYQVLYNLGVLPRGQAANTEDYNAVDDLIDPTIAMLREADVYYLADVDVIEEEAFIPLAHIIAWSCASSFGQQADSSLERMASVNENILRAIQRERPHYDILEVQAY